MKQKIEWYREVLEIEPNSKIFFPLARMLVKDDCADEAISVLRKGIGRHPDHIEARLFLVELLYTANRPLELQQEIETLNVLFKAYPGFWWAWGERLFSDPNTKDAGLAAIFLATFLRNSSVSWSGVIEHGLKGLLVGENLIPSPFGLSGKPEVLVNARVSTDEEKSAKVAEMPVVSPKPVSSVKDGNVQIVFPDNIDDMDCGDDEDELDEPITLRTRSMADILAEQGDIHGALDIYNELLAASASDVERRELQKRIDILTGNAASQQPENEAQGQRTEEKNRLTNMLEVLAQRLEAKSLQ